MKFSIHKHPILFAAAVAGFAGACALGAVIATGLVRTDPAAPQSPLKQAATALVPHKAVYDVKMTARHSGSQVLNISGQMSFEVRDGCDGWTTNHRFNIQYEYTDAPTLVVNSDFSTYESLDGKDFNFSARRRRNGVLYEETRGVGMIRANGTGHVSYSRPEGLSFALPEGSRFPMGHTLDVLRQVKSGTRFLKSVVFDGSDQEGPVEISSFIGAPAAAPVTSPDNEAIDGRLLQSPARFIRMAFFPVMNYATTSDYEMNALFHDNGIISQMNVEYEDFSVIQDLQSLESLPATDCGASARSGATENLNKNSKENRK